jgi:acetyl esterase
MTGTDLDLDPWVADWFTSQFGQVRVDLAAEARAGRLPAFPPRPARALTVSDSSVDGVAVRSYVPLDRAGGTVVYFHGGGFVGGSVAAMDGVARDLAHHSGATVVSVEYRLSPTHPFPSALDDCEAVTRWALTESGGAVAVVGESAGGNLAAAVTLRLRGSACRPLAGQALLYPSVDGPGSGRPSENRYDGVVITVDASGGSWAAYSAGRDIRGDPFAVPLAADDLSDLPPAFVLVAGCDPLRDGGLAYAQRLKAAEVPVTEITSQGQPHGFLNFNFPAAAPAFVSVGEWLRSRLSGSGA